MVLQKKIPKKVVLKMYALALFLTVSCSVEDNFLQNELSKQIIHKRLTLEDLKSNKVIMQKVVDYSKEMKKLSTRSSNSEPYIVDISQANFIETDDFVSYTFNMPTESVAIRNFLLKKSKHDELGFQGYVLNYNLTPEEEELFENNELLDITNKVSSIKLDGEYNLGVFGRNLRTSGTCYGWVGVCYVGDRDGHVAYGSQCTVTGQMFTAFPCPEDGSGGGGGGGGLPPTSPEPPTNPTTPIGGGGREIVVSPISGGGAIIPALITDFSDNCTELKKILTTPELKHALTNLDLEKGGVAEKGWAFKNFPNSTTPSSPIVIPSDPKNPSKVNFDAHKGPTLFGMAHCHTDPQKGSVQMFSFADIIGLMTVYRGHIPANSRPKDPSLYFLGGTFTTGQYMLKISDISKFLLNFNKSGKMEKDLIRVYRDLTESGQLTATNLERAFLKLVKKYDLGIALYKANPTLTNWDEIRLNAQYNNNEPIKTPCP